MPDEKHVRQHYQKLAKNYGLSPLFSMSDPVIRETEDEFFLTELHALARTKPRLRILDLGCGNGHLLGRIRKELPETELVGLEWAPELLELCASRAVENLKLVQADLREPGLSVPLGRFDAVLSQRVLINLLTREAQAEALRNVAELVAEGGVYLHSESYAEPLQRLNKARGEFLLEPMKPSKHNLFLEEESLETLFAKGFREEVGTLEKNHLSTHFFLTRVVHPLLRPEGGAVKQTEFVRFFSAGLGPGVGAYAPILLRRFVR